MIPPKLLLALLGALLSKSERDEVIGDIADEYASREQRLGRAEARRWLRRQVLGSASALLGRRWRTAWGGFQPRADALRPGGTGMGTWLADGKYAVRRLGAHPGYAVLAALTLAIGVGGTSAVYGIARGLLLDPLPYAHEEEIGVFWQETNWNHQEFVYLRGQTAGFQSVALYRRSDVVHREEDSPAHLFPGVFASSELFEVLGTAPVFGRGFRAGDDAEDGERVVVLSWGLWQELGADPSLIGSPINLNGAPRVAIGVMPREFWFPDPSVRLWASERLDPESTNWNSTLVGRAAPGFDIRAMSEPVAGIARMLDERFDYAPQWDKANAPRVTPIRESFVGGMRPALLATLGAMALILLIACANVAALMLGELAGRSSELAVRLAIGATWRRLMQQLVLETLFVAALAGVLGAIIAWIAFPVLAQLLPLGPWAAVSTADWTLFIPAMAIAVLSGLLILLVPTSSLRRGALSPAFRSARTGMLEGRGGRLEGGLVVAQVAFAVLVTSGAALLARSVINLYALDPGVRTEGVAVIDVMVSGGRTRQLESIQALTEALSALPSVQSVGTAQQLPLTGGGYNLTLGIEGRADTEGATTEYRMVTPGYFEAVGMTLLEGRTLTVADRGDTERVVVINRAFAETYLPGTDALGQSIGGDIGSTARIVGVVADAAERQLTDQAVPVRYVPLAQMPWVDEAQSLVVRSDATADPGALVEEVRRTVERVAPGVPIRATTTMSAVLDSALGPVRQVMVLLSLLTGLALLLGAVGVYGVISHFAQRRRRDLAIRMALGLAAGTAVGRLVGRAAALVGLGFAIGLVAWAMVGRQLSSLLYGVPGMDPVALTVVAVVLLTVGIVAALVPARRAAVLNLADVLHDS